MFPHSNIIVVLSCHSPLIHQRWETIIINPSLLGKYWKMIKTYFQVFSFSNCFLSKLNFIFPLWGLSAGKTVIFTSWRSCRCWWASLPVSPCHPPVSPLNSQVSGLRPPSLRPQYCWVLPTWRSPGLNIIFKHSVSSWMSSVNCYCVIDVWW